MISTIIPVYIKNNYVLELFKSTLKNLTRQTYTDIEILIISNGNSEETIINIVSQCSDPRIKIYNLKNVKSAQKAMNFGYGKASGECINFHDQDDISNVDRYEKLIKYLEESKDDVVASQIMVREIGVKQRLKGFNQEEIIKKFIERGLVKSPAHFGSILMKKEIFKDVGGFEGMLTADSLFCIKMNLLRYFGSGKLLHIYKEPLFSWIRHKESNTSGKRGLFKSDSSENRDIILENREKIIKTTNKSELKDLIGIRDNISECSNIEYELLKG